jgi:predicted nucleic acid-binding protein
MCLIIDSCAFSPVFNARDKLHSQFAPVFEWVIRGKGKIVYGGSTYKEELKNAKRYLALFVELKRSAKVVEVDDDVVDRLQAGLKKRVNQRKFNDPHLVAIVIASRCRLIATNDHQAIPFLTRNDLYPRGLSRPRIYTRPRNKNLLRDSNMVDICVPSKSLKGLGRLFK